MHFFETFRTFVFWSLWLRYLVGASLQFQIHSILFLEGCHLERQIFRLLFCIVHMGKEWSTLNRVCYRTL